ncbi:MAG: response regulator transcription factor [Elusimicrobia bacterium]|nr:response regulator transcription factor [Elusimicrobiota bacterium]
MCKVKIMLIDRDHKMREVLRKFLAFKGYSLVMCELHNNDPEGTGTVCPDVVLLEGVSCENSANDICTRISEKFHSDKIILVTSGKDAEIKGSDAGEKKRSFIRKPLDFDCLEAMVSIVSAC